MPISVDDALAYLLGRLSAHTPPVFFAEILEQLSWITDDNMVSMYRIMHDWLNSDDKEKVKIALSITEVLLLRSDEEYHATVT